MMQRTRSGAKKYRARPALDDPRWEIYENFLEDMGRKPGPEYSLDRIDNAKGYSKGNCRWASQIVQQRNKTNIKLTEEDVFEIRWQAYYGVQQKVLADTYKVSRPTICEIVNGRKWFWPSVVTEP
jgi:hypothetical protein